MGVPEKKKPMKAAMNPTVIVLALLGASLSSHAQQPTGPGAPDGKNDSAPTQQVASPNRTHSQAWATAGKAGKSGKARQPGETADLAPIVWVDSTGRTMGRAIGNFAILAMHDNRLATITGLGADSKCDAGRGCTYASNGAKWSEFESVYYTTADCTGTPYSISGAVGTPYLGIPITDNGGTYLYFFKAVDITRVTLGSRYSTSGCFVIGSRGAFPTDATPVSDVVPATTYGTPPFFLK